MGKTRAAWVIAIVGLLGYEAYTLMNNVPSDTLSEAIWEWSRHPLLPFLFGFLMGHFFWQRRSQPQCGHDGVNHYGTSGGCLKGGKAREPQD